MQEIINHAKAGFLQEQERITRALANTPDERVNWSPSPSARSIAQQVAHAGQAVNYIQTQMSGQPFEYPTPVEADAHFREFEQQFTTREKALEFLEANCAAYVAWLDALTPEQFAGNMALPFKLGEAPIAMAISFPADHMRWHISQIEYIQTIYGDRDWYLGSP
jgi:hypothetical protein